ncbi:GNAT family N-acetyltransferase [Falsibacillus pallidus]|uniref:Acetyltransferase (GNAT) family protein n=1 Tax=Falsibacillus pallidus TaxID=493781 RepID=A0A370GHG3_9BACI|nr:N-acetyltransferase [Falsibacillus pallidus]RDI43212.1 acetyltransferase (GNAT) family protein [Falsibacillus pallidus]
MEIKRLSKCTLDEAVMAWNKGFEGYFFDATTDIDKFTKRLIGEGMLPSMSIIGFVNDSPSAIVLSGKRDVQGTSISWNGGTGVALQERGKGLGEKMIEHSLNIYEEEGVDAATLEAILENEKAINLYKKMGYQIVDHIRHYALKGNWKLSHSKENKGIIIKKADWPTVKRSGLYLTGAPWQAHWEHIQDAEIMVCLDHEESILAYAIYKKMEDENGQIQRIGLFQANSHANEAGKAALKELLHVLYQAEHDSISRMAAYIQDSQSDVVDLLKEIGFETTVSQVMMAKSLTDKGKEYIDRVYSQINKQTSHS